MSNIIEIEFTIKLPDVHLETLTTKENKTQKWWYKGDAICYAVVNRDNNNIVSCIDEKTLNSGRPIPPNYTYIRVDATIETLIAYILRPPKWDDSEKNDDYESGKLIIENSVDDIYPEFSYPTPFQPNHVYDETVTYDTSIKRLIVTFASHPPTTWEIVRSHRDRVLFNSDGMVAPDMPEDIKNKYTTYRQALRDLPEKLSHVSPWSALNMFPKPPSEIGEPSLNI